MWSYTYACMYPFDPYNICIYRGGKYFIEKFILSFILLYVHKVLCPHYPTIGKDNRTRRVTYWNLIRQRINLTESFMKINICITSLWCHSALLYLIWRLIGPCLVQKIVEMRNVFNRFCSYPMYAHDMDMANA